MRATRATPAPHTALTRADLAAVERHLAATDALLERAYPGDTGSRQPVHTAYVPGDAYTPVLPGDWGRAALAAADAHGGAEQVANLVGMDAALAEKVAPLVRAKLVREPVEDLRIDFEDGYGDRGDDVEDADVVRAAARVEAAKAGGLAPPYLGIRFKSLEAPTRARGIRTLDLFIGALLEHGELPAGLVFTVPKVSTVAQVEATVELMAALERAYGLETGRLIFEVQVETPQLVLAHDGTAPVAWLPHVASGRLMGLHFGTYDYSAALGIAARYQSLEHPAADHAKQVMQLAVAGTGVRLSDGSSNLLPVGDRTEEAWRLHARLVRRSLERGFIQGWDLHPHQLLTRYLATYAFYREGWPEASARLRRYRAPDAADGSVLDEPATVRALAGFVLRGLQCGALPAAEVLADTGLDAHALTALAHPPRPRADDAREAT